MPALNNPITASGFPAMHLSMVTPKAVAGTAHTLAADVDTLDFTGASLCTVTVPTGMPPYSFLATGAGGALLVAGAGVTLTGTNGTLAIPAGTRAALLPTSTAGVYQLANGEPAGASSSARTFHGAVANQAGMLATSAAVVGDWVKRTDLSGAGYELVAAGPSTLGNWVAMSVLRTVNFGDVANEAAMLALSSAGVGDRASRVDLGGLMHELRATPASTLSNWKALAPVSASTLPTVTSFSAAVQLDGNRITPKQVVTGAIAFTVAASPVEGGRLRTKLMGDGINTPTFAGFVRKGGVAIGNTANQAYLIDFEYRQGAAYYTIELGEAATTEDMFITDVTAAAGGTELIALASPQTNNAWVKRVNASGGTITGQAAVTGSNFLRGPSDANTAALAYQQGNIALPGLGGLRAYASMKNYSTTTGLYFSLFLRGNNTTTGNLIQGTFRGAGVFELSKRLANSNTVLQTQTVSDIVDGTDFEMELRVAVNLQRLYYRLTGSPTWILVCEGSAPDSELSPGLEAGAIWGKTGIGWGTTVGMQPNIMRFGPVAVV